MTPPKEPTTHDRIAKVIAENDALLVAALSQAATGSFLIPLPSTEETKGKGESLPVEERFSEENAPTVVIVTRATPEAHNNIAALLARYRGDNPKAEPKKRWFW